MTSPTHSAIAALGVLLSPAVFAGAPVDSAPPAEKKAAEEKTAPAGAAPVAPFAPEAKVSDDKSDLPKRKDEERVAPAKAKHRKAKKAEPSFYCPVCDAGKSPDGKTPAPAAPERPSLAGSFTFGGMVSDEATGAYV